MAFYYTCPLCGSNLDPGEHCNCEREKEQEEAKYLMLLCIEQSGQICFDLEKINKEKETARL